MSIRLLLAACATLGLNACANLNSIHRIDSISGATEGRAIFIDAKQRAILTSRVLDPNSIDPKKPIYIQRYCSEPAPDAFSAFSTALSGDLAGSGLNGASPELKARAAIAMSETAGTIERTQTINLLRESMFRTCERFMGGAISTDEFIIQAARDQRAMVAVLAIEQLTGAVKAKSTILSSGASSATYSDPSALYDALEKAQDAEADALEAKDKAKIDFETKIGAKTCADILKEKEPAAGTPAEVDKYKSETATCNARQAELDATTKKHARAEKRAQTFQAMADKTAFGLSASSGAGASFDAGGLAQANRPGAEAFTEVAKQVAKIVKGMNDFDEIEMTCVVRLRSASRLRRTGLEEDLDNRCLELIATRVDTATATAKARTDEAISARYAAIAPQADAIESYLTTDPAVAKEKWKAMIDRIEMAGRSAPFLINQYRNISNISDMISSFKNWTSKNREIILSSLKSGALK